MHPFNELFHPESKLSVGAMASNDHSLSYSELVSHASNFLHNIYFIRYTKIKYENIIQSAVGVSLIQDVAGPTQQLSAQEHQTRQPQETSLCNQVKNGSQKPENSSVLYVLIVDKIMESS